MQEGRQAISKHVGSVASCRRKVKPLELDCGVLVGGRQERARAVKRFGDGHISVTVYKTPADSATTKRGA
jgi:hypothetical protein